MPRTLVWLLHMVQPVRLSLKSKLSRPVTVTTLGLTVVPLVLRVVPTLGPVRPWHPHGRVAISLLLFVIVDSL